MAVGLVLLFAAMLLCFGYAVERLMLRPLRRLQQSARAIANGSYDVSLPPGGQDEIGDLSNAFGVMADKVRQHTAELESKVRERTSELENANRAMAAAHKKIGDSIDYASLIQRAILPDRQLTQSLGEHHFVLWKPRDVVGGDFTCSAPMAGIACWASWTAPATACRRADDHAGARRHRPGDHRGRPVRSGRRADPHRQRDPRHACGRAIAEGAGDQYGRGAGIY